MYTNKKKDDGKQLAKGPFIDCKPITVIVQDSERDNNNQSHVKPASFTVSSELSDENSQKAKLTLLNSIDSKEESTYLLRHSPIK